MSGAEIRLTGADAALAALGEAAARAEHPKDLFDEIGASLVVSTQRRFEAGVGPDGSPWPPSIRALAEGGRTLVDSGRLMQSLTHVPSDAGVEVGTNVLYAAIHQFGGTVRPVKAAALHFKLLGQDIFVDHVTIPARPFLGLDADDEREILAIAADYLAGPETGGADGG
jgi:phage virion morphogenesis protein